MLNGVLKRSNYSGLELVIPDDYPPLITDSLALLHIKKESPIPVRVYNEKVSSEHSLVTRLRKAHTIVRMNPSTPIGIPILESCPELKHIALWGGTNENIDLNSASRMGVFVSSAAGEYAEAVAEHALSMALALAHRLTELNERIRLGDWPGGYVTQLTGKIMGIVGGGKVGMQMAKLSSAIGMKVVVANKSTAKNLSLRSFENSYGVTTMKMDDLLEEADVISLHTRPDPSLSTRMFGRDEFATMKSSALFINTASPRLVDERALAHALHSETIAGAALDVLENEPPNRRNPLTTLPNVILTPHIASHTTNTVEKGLEILSNNISNFFLGNLEGIKELNRP